MKCLATGNKKTVEVKAEPEEKLSAYRYEQKHVSVVESFLMKADNHSNCTFYSTLPDDK